VARVTFNGNPGEVFTNDTDRVLYQFVVSWRNSCGQCAQFDHAIGPYWPIPLHRSCRCQQRPVLPGQSAESFVDYREEIRQLDPHQQAAVVGRSNWALIEKGVVDWEDVVTPTRVRDLREVVALNKLSVEQMTEAGVGRRIAAEAYQSVNTPEHRLIERRQRELVAALGAKGLSARQIKRAVGLRVAGRVGIDPVPSPPKEVPSVSASESLWAALARRLGLDLAAIRRRLARDAG
jgi:hypothetical protein